MTISDTGVTGQLTDHLDSLRLHLRRRLADEQDVQDLTQEACLRFLTANVQGIDNPRAYLYQIANRLLWQHYTRRTKIIDTSMDIDALPAPQSPLEDTVMAQTRQELVEEAMHALSPKCQTAIVLRWRHGLRVAEIAERMNLSRGMVKKYLANGLEHFRRRLRRSPLPIRAYDAIPPQRL